MSGPPSVTSSVSSEPNARLHSSDTKRKNTNDHGLRVSIVFFYWYRCVVRVGRGWLGLKD